MTIDNLHIPLPPKEVDCPIAHVKRIVLSDPAIYYERVKDELNVYSRYNLVNFDKLFPTQESQCSCGCGAEVRPKKKWATNECQRFAHGIWCILNGNTQMILYYLTVYYGNRKCVQCGGEATQADHIVAVANGGGGSWLSNFQLLCHECHKVKTREDLGWTKLGEKKGSPKREKPEGLKDGDEKR